MLEYHHSAMPNDLRDHVLNFDSCYKNKRGFRYHGLSHGIIQDPHKSRIAKKKWSFYI